MKSPLTIETEIPGVYLRELASLADDYAYFDAICENPAHLSQFGDDTAGKYQSFEDVQLRRMESRDTDELRMGIWNEEKFVGFVKAAPSEDGNEAEIGYFLRASATGHGYATVAVRALSEYVRPNYNRVFAEVHAQNEKSMWVLDRAGFWLVGVERREWGTAVIFELPYEDAFGYPLESSVD